MVNVSVFVIIVLALFKRELFDNLLKKINSRSDLVGVKSIPGPISKVNLIEKVEEVVKPKLDVPDEIKLKEGQEQEQVDFLKIQGVELLNSLDNLPMRIKDEYETLPSNMQKVVNSGSYECVMRLISSKPRLHEKNPILNDLLVTTIVERELTPEDIDDILSFLFDRCLYREIALIMSLRSSLIPYYHFLSYQKNHLSRVIDFLIPISQSGMTQFRVESLFNHKDGYNFVAPLVAAENFNEQVFKNVVNKFLEDSRTDVVQLIKHICYGITIQAHIHDDRNDFILKYLDSKLENQSISVYLSIKTGKILTLMKNDNLGDEKDERITKLIYKNAYSSKDSTRYIYGLLMSFAESSRNEHLMKLIQKYFG